MNLSQRLAALEELARGRRVDAEEAEMRLEIEAMKREIRQMTDGELKAYAAADYGEERDPELAARLAEMTDDELCRFALEWGREHESITTG